MSLRTFELKQEHIILLSKLNWGMREDHSMRVMADTTIAPFIHNMGGEDDEEVIPFGENTIYEGINLVLNGMTDQPEYDLPDFTPEQKNQFMALYKELPTAVEVILRTQGFTLGIYKAKYPGREWKLVTPK